MATNSDNGEVDWSKFKPRASATPQGQDEEEVDWSKFKPRYQDVPDATLGSVARDVVSGALQIGPTALKVGADIARMATGDRLGKGLSDSMGEGIESIKDVVGSDRAKAQRHNFEADMRNDAVGIGETISRNKGALADQILPTVGSMLTPVGAAAIAGRAVLATRAAQAMTAAERAARVASVQQAAGIGTVAAQNAADTFSTLLEQGASMQDAYLGAGITVPFSVVAGALTKGGAEGAITRALSGRQAAQAGVKQFLGATGREGAQEMGEELGQITGEAVGSGVDPTMTSVGKRLAVAGTLGAVMGGGVDVANQTGNLVRPQQPGQPQPPATPPAQAPGQQAPQQAPQQTQQQAPQQAGSGVTTNPVNAFATTEQVTGFAQTRLGELQAKRDGTPDQTIQGPDGNPLVVPGKPQEFMRPEEKAELDFLEQNIGNTQAIADAYRIGIDDQAEQPQPQPQQAAQPPAQQVTPPTQEQADAMLTRLNELEVTSQQRELDPAEQQEAANLASGLEALAQQEEAGTTPEQTALLPEQTAQLPEQTAQLPEQQPPAEQPTQPEPVKLTWPKFLASKGVSASKIRRDTPEWVALKAEYEAAKAQPVAAGIPGSENGPVTVGGATYNLTPEQREAWDRLDAEYRTMFSNMKAQAEREQAAFDSTKHDDPDFGFESPMSRYEKARKAAGYELSAKRRAIVGALTPKEQAAAKAEAARIRAGDTVEYDGMLGTVEKPAAFGRVSVLMDDGSRVSVPHDQLKKAARPDELPTQGETDGTQAPQAFQAETQGQQAPSIPDAAATLPEQVIETAPAPVQANDDGIVLQNRDRRQPASVMQMQSIEREPHYPLLGASGSPETGAPMVFAEGDDNRHILPMQYGRESLAIIKNGVKVPFRYAVVSADQVQPSHFSDGSTNAAYNSKESGTIKALNNARTAGVRGAYARGTAGQYQADLMADAVHLGIDPQAVANTPNPMLVRLYSEKYNGPHMGAASQSAALGMTPRELAIQDAAMLSPAVVRAYQGGDIDSAANRDFVRGFFGALQANGQDVASMMSGAELNQDGIRRISAAMVQTAYGDSDLVQEMFESTQPEIKAIGEALKAVAGDWAKMRAAAANGALAPEVDITGNVLKALKMVRRMRQDGMSLIDQATQTEVFSGKAPDALTVNALRMFYTGQYLTRANPRTVVEKLLREYVTIAGTVTAGPDMFGERVTPNDILATITQKGIKDAASQADQGARPESAAPGSGQEPDGGGTAGNVADEAGRGNQRPGDEARGQGAAASSAEQPGSQDREVPASREEGAEGTGEAAGRVTAQADDFEAMFDDVLAEEVAKTSDVGLGSQLAALNAELERQGGVQNASTRAKRDAIRLQIAEQDFPEILAAVDGDIGTAEEINTALKYAGDEPKAKTIARVLKKRGITEAYAQRWADRLLGGQASAEDAPRTATQSADGGITKAIENSKRLLRETRNKIETEPAQTKERKAQLKQRENDLEKEIRLLRQQAAAEMDEPGRTATQSAASAAKNTAAALSSAIDGLGALFGGNGRLNSGLSFDEETYAKAKPHFQQALASLKDAGSDLKEAMRTVVRMVLDKFGEAAATNMKPYVVRFIQEMAAGQSQKADPNQEKPSLNAPNGRKVIAQEIADHLIGGNRFATIVEARRFIADLTGQKVEPGTREAKLADETVELAVVMAGRDIVQAARKQDRPDSVIFERLVSLYDAQPSLNVRDSESVKNQAYSTPAPLAFVASRLAGISQSDKVGEPTAGNGMLVMEVSPENATLNELSQQRGDNLASLGFENVGNLNAAGHDLAPAKSLDAVVMNPPFGVVRNEQGDTVTYEVMPNYTTGEIDHAIVFKALQAMKDDGKAVLIIGGTLAESDAGRRDAYRGKAKREFFYNLHQQYNVVDHFTAGGDLYKKQGATYPVDVIVIHGRGKSERKLPAASLPPIIETWGQLKEKLNADTTSLGSEGASDDRGDRAAGGSDADGGRVSQPPELSDQGTGDGGRLGRSEAGGAQSERGGVAGSDVSGAAGSGNASDLGKLGNASPSEGPRDSGQPDVNGSRDQGKLPGTGSPGRNNPGDVGSGSRGEQNRARLSEGDAEKLQVKYSNFSGNKSVNTLVATNHLSALERAFANLQQRVGNIDEYVKTRLQYDDDGFKKAFSAEQVEALALAIDNIEQGRGFIIGDQTGIGKGRVVAAMIRYAKLNGKTPVFVTQMPDLYGDMMRDLNDIGMSGFKPLMTNNNASVPLDAEALAWFGEVQAINSRVEELTEEITRLVMEGFDGKRTKEELSAAVKVAMKASTNPEIISLRDEIAELKQSKPQKRGKFLETPDIKKHEGALKKLVEAGNIGDHDAIFTTYNQMAALDSGKPKKDKDGRKTGPSAPEFGYRNEFLQSMVNQNAMLILDESHNAGSAGDGKFPKLGDVVRDLVNKSGSVFYSSATFAKSPEVMDVYSKTDLGKAFDSPDALMQAIKTVPQQQVASAMLVEAGQYIRRERSFDGIEYKIDTVETDAQASEDVSTAMRTVVEFDAAKKAAIQEIQQALDAEGAMMASTRGGISAGSVDSTNFTSVMHNVINTFLLALKADAAADTAIAAIKAGEKPVLTVANTMEMFITDYAKEAGIGMGEAMNATFADVLMRYLERTRLARIKHGNGDEQVLRLSDAQLGPDGVYAFEQAKEFIQQMTLQIPLSPIDHIKRRIQEAGYSIGEITGRQTVVEDGVLRPRNKAELNTAGKKNTIAKFNGGGLDALVINRSGSTGLSMHASETFADQRRRVMIVAQAEPDINNHMQMLGRINRTGQVTKAPEKVAAWTAASYGLPRYVQLTANVPIELRPAAVLSGKMAKLSANTTAGRRSAVEDSNAPDFMNKYGDEVAALVVGNDFELNRKLGFPITLDEQGAPRTENAISKVTGRIGLLPLSEQSALYERIGSEYRDLIAQLDALGKNDLEAKIYPLDAKELGKTEVIAGDSASPFTAPVIAEQVDVRKLGKPYSSEKVRELVAKSLGGMTAKKHRDGLIDSFWREMNAEIAAARLEGAAGGPAGMDAANRKQDALRAAYARFSEALPTLGEPVVIKTENGNIYGIPYAVTRKEGAKSVGALSAWRIDYAVVDGSRVMRFPMTKVFAHDGANVPESAVVVQPATTMTVVNADRSGFDSIPVMDGFDRGQTDSRETRTVLTGNLLRASAAFPGRLISFTTSDGQIRQGLMTASTFDIKAALAKMTPTLKDPWQMVEFLNRGGEIIDRETGGDILKLRKNANGRFEILSGKAGKGRRIAAEGGLYMASSGNKMRTNLHASQAEELRNFLHRVTSTMQIQLTTTKETKDLLGGNAPKFSRSESTQAAYEARIDALFGGGKAQTGTKVLDRSDVMGLLGHPNLPLVLNESHLLNDGMEDHPEMTASAWKRVPDWIENPAAAYLSTGQNGRDRVVLLGPELLAGYPVIMVIEPSPGVVGGKPGQAPREQLLVTAFAKTTGIVRLAEAAKNGKLVYLQKKMAPAIGQSGRVQFPKHSDISTGRTRILDEKHLAAYRRANSPAFSASGSAPNSERLDSPTITKIADAVKAGWAQAADVVVVETMQDARVPKAARDEDAKQRAMGAAPARGFYHDGKVYLVAEGLASERDVVETMLHESLGHHGLRGVFGSDLDGILDQIITVRLAQVRAKAEAAGIDWKKEGRPALRNAAEEILADMAQNTPELGFVRRTIAAIRTWARKNVPGFRGMAVTDAEIIRAYIMPARGWVQRGAQASSGAGPVAFQRVWHGTPHRGIEKFSTDKIGTGEGAQAYGWGLYFASKKEVAEWYRRSLADGLQLGNVKVEAKDIRRAPPEFLGLTDLQNQVIRDAWLASDFTPSGLVNALEDSRSRYESIARTMSPRGNLEAEKYANAIKKVLGKVSPIYSGQLYEVDIPEDSEMLLWDKPLSEQPEVVRQAIEGLMASDVWDADTRKLIGNADIQGKKFYEALAGVDAFAGRGEFGKAASEALLAAGIKGVKYLDGTSRSAGDGSYNYVIFDGADAEIAGVHFSRGARSDVNRMTQEQIQAEIGQLMPRVNQAYESGQDALAERLDARLEELMAALDAAYSEVEEDSLAGSDLANQLTFAAANAAGSGGDAEADMVRDMANIWREMNGLNGKPSFFKRTEAEKAQMIRGLASDYEHMHGGLRDGLTDAQVLDAAKEAYETVYGLRSRQIDRIKKRSAGVHFSRGGIESAVSVADYYNTPGARELAHRVKAGDANAINEMARLMAQSVPNGAVLVPMPSRTGKATAMLKLAQRIADLRGGRVEDVLSGQSRESVYDMKKSGREPTPDMLNMQASRKVPDGAFIVDAVIDTGATAAAALQQLPGARLLTFATVRKEKKSATGNNGDFSPTNPSIVREKEGQTYDLKKRLDEFTRSEPDASQAGAGKQLADARADAADAVLRLGSGDSALGRTLAQEIAAKQRVNLIGHQIESAEDLAALAQVYRNPAFETMRMVFVNADRRVVAQMGVTSRLPSSSQAIMGNDMDSWMQQVNEAAREKGAVAVYLLHNHPSGDASVSRADVEVTKRMAQSLASIGGVEVRSHVVIDTNEFSVIEPTGAARKIKRDFGALAPLTHPEFGAAAIQGPADVMRLAKRMQLDDDAVTLMVLDSGNRVKAVTDVPAAAVRDNTTAANRRMLLRSTLSKQGAKIIAVARDPNLLRKLDGLVKDGIVVLPSGKAASLLESGVLFRGDAKLWPSSNDRAARFSPDTSPEFMALAPNGQPAIIGQGVQLAFAQPSERFEVIPAPGERIINFAVMPRDRFDVLGHVELLMGPNGKVKSLLDIELNARGDGYGRKVIETLLQANRGGLHISNIVQSARGFWERMGIPQQNLEEGAAYDGFIDLESYQAAGNGRATSRATNPAQQGGAGSDRRADAAAKAGTPGLAGPGAGGQRVEAPNALYQAKARAQALTSRESLSNLVYQFQDKYIDLKNIRDHIEQLGGTVNDLNDAYLGEELYHARLSKRTQDFLRDELKPLLAEMKRTGIGMAELEQYLHARHAPEANREMEKANPNQLQIDAGRLQADAAVKALEMQLQRATAAGSATKAIESALEQAKREASNWRRAQPFKGTEDERRSLSGMSDKDAADHIANLAPGKAPLLAALAARVDAINAQTLDTLQRYGLMDAATLNTWRSTYSHYVPLHRDEAHPESNSHPTGQGFNTRGDAAKRRTGSNAKVTDILAHVVMQREAALTRGEKNLVAKKVYMLAAQNPDPNVWSLVKPKLSYIDPSTGFVVRGTDPNYARQPNVLMVRIGGKDQAVVFNEHNPEAMRLAGSLKNADASDLGFVASTVGKATRWFAAVNTQYNPIFGVINFIRDVGEGNINLSSTELAGQQKQVLAGIFPAMRAIYTTQRKGIKGTQGWAALWEEFQTVGGITGYRDLFLTAQDRAKDLQKELKSFDDGRAMRAFKGAVEWLNHYNETMENAVRLSAYKTGLDAGMTKERAASLAKNLTVNFNRKGARTTGIGAFYAFFNAAVQGTTRMVKTLRGPAGRKILMAGVALGAVNSMVAMAMMGAGGDDDEDHYEKIPEFIKEKNLIIPLGREDFVSVPMPLGFAWLHNVGRLSAEWAFGGKDKTLGKQVGRMMGALLHTFNPLGGDGDLGMTLAPTVIDPAVALMRNKDWTGRTIYKEDMSDTHPTPGHTRAKATASTPSRWIAEGVNTLTGGDDWAPGAVSWTPDQIDYVIGQLTGGVGRELMKVNQIAAAPFTGDEIPAHKIPLAGRLYGNTRGPSAQAEPYYQNMREINLAAAGLKGRLQSDVDTTDFIERTPMVQMIEQGKAINNHVSRLRQAKMQAIRQGLPGFRDQVRDIDAEITQSMKRLNQDAKQVREGAR